MISQETIGQVLVFADQSEEQMLGFDCRATKLAGFVRAKKMTLRALSVYLSNINFDSHKCLLWLI
jgi:hypothetical protein